MRTIMEAMRFDIERVEKVKKAYAKEFVGEDGDQSVLYLRVGAGQEDQPERGCHQKACRGSWREGVPGARSVGKGGITARTDEGFWIEATESPRSSKNIGGGVRFFERHTSGRAETGYG